ICCLPAARHGLPGLVLVSAFRLSRVAHSTSSCGECPANNTAVRRTGNGPHPDTGAAGAGVSAPAVLRAAGGDAARRRVVADLGRFVERRTPPTLPGCFPALRSVPAVPRPSGA